MTDDRDRPAGQLEVDPELVEEISALVDTGQRGMVLNLVADLYAADLASLLTHLPLDEARRLFQWLPVEDAAEVLPELDNNYRAQLLEQIQPARITALVDELDTDDAADVLSGLPSEITEQVLPALEDAADLQALLEHPEDTAGGIMGTEFVAVPLDWTVADATEEVRRNADRIGEIYNVFVVDDHHRLRGKVSPTRLLLSPSHASIESIMETDVLSVRTGVDQEEVAQMMERYDLVSMPVVDANSRLIGRITIDDVVDVIREEAAEDIQRMHGLTGDEQPTHSIFRISRGRLPWLLVGLFGAGLSATVIGTFEEGLAQAIVLVFFIPVVTAMGGNVAVQSAAIAVQGLSSGDLWLGDMLTRIGKELAVALVNGLVIALVLSIVVLFLDLGDVTRLVLTLGITMFAVTILATTNGTLIPFLLKRMGIDPASAIGPFVTTLNDIIGLTVYFIVATIIYL